jgi:UDP-3-O-[3-hydroxymyristoyl] glucosamine N-acyltransferase
MKLGEVARALGASLEEGTEDVEITGVAALEDAVAGQITFLADRRHEGLVAATTASAILLAPGGPAASIPVLRVENPYAAFAQVLALFHPPFRPPVGVHPTAVIAPTAVLGDGASVGPHAVVGDGARIGRNAVLYPNVTIYRDVRIGDDFTAHAGVVVREDVMIGDRVTLHAGAVVGSDGFGFVPGPDAHQKIPQVGTVVLEDDVEIGSNATVDRATLGATHVGRGSKIDNLVMIGHGSRLGPHCLLAGQAGLAGSTRLGHHVMMGGQAGASGHLSIGDGVQIAAQTGIHRDIPAGAVYGGYPAMEVRRWRRVTMSIPKLPDLFRRLRRLEKAAGVASEDDDEQ